MKAIWFSKMAVRFMITAALKSIFNAACAEFAGIEQNSIPAYGFVTYCFKSTFDNAVADDGVFAL